MSERFKNVPNKSVIRKNRLEIERFQQKKRRIETEIDEEDYNEQMKNINQQRYAVHEV